MLSKKQMVDKIKNKEYESQTIDGRDLGRLFRFFTFDEAKATGMLKEDADPKNWGEVTEWTKENILKQLKDDVDFGFEKALDQRGLSAGSMYEVVKMWMLILEDELFNFDEYAQYGLPLFKAVAVKYGFDNPIGDDEGNENKYASGY